MSDEHQDLAARDHAAAAGNTAPQDAQNDWITQGEDGEYLYSLELIEPVEGPSVEGEEGDFDAGIREYQSVEIHGVIVYGTAPGQRLPGYLSKAQKEMVQGLSAQIDLGAGADAERVRSLFAELKASGLVLTGELDDLRMHINHHVPHADLVAEEGR